VTCGRSVVFLWICNIFVQITPNLYFHNPNEHNGNNKILHLCRSASSFLIPLIFLLHFRKNCTRSVFFLKLGSLQVLPWNLRTKDTEGYSLFAENGVIVRNLNYRPWQWVYSISGCKSFPGCF
jgi:hypothetical protein